MGRGRLFTRALVGLSAIALLAPPAHAQRAPGKAEAEALFEQAKTRAAQGDYAHACPLFADSQRIDPGLGTMLWLADCYENNGQLASAWAQFKEAEGVAAQRKDTREKVAHDHAAALAVRLAKMVVRAPAAVIDGLQVRRDGAAIPAAELGLEVPVDPGKHTVQAEAPGRRPWSTTVDVPPHSAVVAVDVPALARDPAAGPPPVVPLPDSGPPPGAPATSEERDDRASVRRTWRIAGIAAGATGAAAIGAGVGFAVAAKSTYNAANDGPCNGSTNVCTTPGLGQRQDAYHLAAAATVFDVVGGIALAGGVVSFLVGMRHPSQAPGTGLSVLPVVATQGRATTFRWDW